ncbi:alpha/beta fold hydrolase [bacterium]|nr:alpha/beta fold hydrolase [bacterium]
MADVVYRSEQAASDVEEAYRRVLDRWPVARKEHEIETRFGSTFVVSSGPASAPPVVLLHGAQANSAAWFPDIALWSRRFRLLAVDLPGEPGLSARVRLPLNTEDHALWLDDVFSGLEVSSAAIVGTSFGGWLALDYATRRPTAVNALVLIVPGGIGRQKNFLLTALPLMLLGRWGERKAREMVFGPRPAVLPHSLAAISPLMDMIGRVVKPRVVTMPRLTDEQLKSLRVPILAILAGRDVLLDSSETRHRLSAHVPHARINFDENGRHYLTDQSERVFEFLDTLFARPNS